MAINSINLFDAANAYGRPIGGVATGARPSPATDSGGGSEDGFGAMVSQMVGGTTTALGKAEQVSIRQVAGKGDLIDVVTAMGAAETALDTMVAVRDKMVAAYGEIMRMQI